jgi:hypothetical protein
MLTRHGRRMERDIVGSWKGNQKERKMGRFRLIFPTAWHVSNSKRDTSKAVLEDRNGKMRLNGRA